MQWTVMPQRGTGVAATLLVLAAAPAAAQLPPVPDAMQRVDFLVGEWAGDGWMEAGPGRRNTFRGTERVERRMGGRVVVVEGDFTADFGGGNVVPVHQALGIISYDAAAERFDFRTWTAQGVAGHRATAAVRDNTMIWGYDDPAFGTVRFTITLTPAGEWHEVGHVSPDGGTSWHQFFEMRLQKVNTKVNTGY